MYQVGQHAFHVEDCHFYHNSLRVYFAWIFYVNVPLTSCWILRTFLKCIFALSKRGASKGPETLYIQPSNPESSWGGAPRGSLGIPAGKGCRGLLPAASSTQSCGNRASGSWGMWTTPWGWWDCLHSLQRGNSEWDVAFSSCEINPGYIILPLFWSSLYSDFSSTGDGAHLTSQAFGF